MQSLLDLTVLDIVHRIQVALLSLSCIFSFSHARDYRYNEVGLTRSSRRRKKLKMSFMPRNTLLLTLRKSPAQLTPCFPRHLASFGLTYLGIIFLDYVTRSLIHYLASLSVYVKQYERSRTHCFLSLMLAARCS